MLVPIRFLRWSLRAALSQFQEAQCPWHTSSELPQHVAVTRDSKSVCQDTVVSTHKRLMEPHAAPCLLARLCPRPTESEQRPTQRGSRIPEKGAEPT